VLGKYFLQLAKIFSCLPLIPASTQERPNQPLPRRAFLIKRAHPCRLACWFQFPSSRDLELYRFEPAHALLHVRSQAEIIIVASVLASTSLVVVVVVVVVVASAAVSSPTVVEERDDARGLSTDRDRPSIGASAIPATWGGIKVQLASPLVG
jgi:hypothetical protein